MNRHIVLLGDSVFDNKVYVGDEASVSEHVGALLPDDAVTLLAVDGSLTTGLSKQVEQIDPRNLHFIRVLTL